MPVSKTGKKKVSTGEPERKTLPDALKVFYGQWKAANRSPRGAEPGWVKELTLEGQEQYRQLRQQAAKVDKAAMPSAEEIGKAVLGFWAKKHSK